MGDIFSGKTSSGTPLETRGGTNQLAQLMEAAMRGNSSGMQNFLQGMRPADPNATVSRSIINMLGFDPSTVDFSGALDRGLADPRDQTAGLFSALQPLERQMMDEAATGLRGQMGTTGGRFGRAAGSAEARLRADLASRNMATRENSLLTAQNNANQFASSILGIMLPSMLQTGTQQQGLDNDLLRSFMSFFQPGGPVIQEGILPGLLGAGVNLAGMGMLRGGK